MFDKLLLAKLFTPNLDGYSLLDSSPILGLLQPLIAIKPMRLDGWVRIVILTLSGWICWTDGQAAQFEEPFRVMILRNTSQYVPSAILQDRGMREAFAASGTRNVELFLETMDTMWFDRSEIEPEFLSLFQKKYGGRKIDLLMAAGADALDVAQRLREVLLRGVPIVFYNVAEDALRGRSIQADITGIALRFDLPGTLALAMRLQAHARRIVVVNGSSPYDNNWLRRAREALRTYEGRFEISYWSGQRLQQLLENLRKLSEDTMVLYLAFSDDGVGSAYSPADVAKRIAGASAAPVYGVLESYLGQGIVGGAFPSFESHGRLAGQLALRVLSGEKPESIAVQTSPRPVAKIDWRELRRWGLDVKRLPPGSIVQFREMTFWEQYRWYVIAALAIIALQAVLILGLLLEHARRKRSEADLRRNRDQLAHVTRVSTLGELAASLAHELNQPLTAILSNAQAAQRFLRAKPEDLEEVREILKDIVADNSRAGEVIRRLRALVKKEEPEFAPINIASVIGEVVELVHSDGILRNIRLQLECQDGLPNVRGDRVQLQQVVLNLLINAFDAMKDGNAQEHNVKVRAIANGAGTVEISVRDHGTGLTSNSLGKIFQPFYTTKRDGLGMGLSISRSIVEAHGGQLWARNNVEHGATFYFTIPTSM
jgi:signal transduction histidine kinase/CheY-like chemotaxis protein